MTDALYGGKILISENGTPIVSQPTRVEQKEEENEEKDVNTSQEEEQEDEEDEFVCPICQGEEQETDSFARPEDCKHVFCEPCITEWSRNANTCPICRNRYEHLCTCATLRGEYTARVKIEYRGTKETPEADHYCCQLCNSGNNEELLLLCDGCDEAYHTYCISPALSTIPEGDWFCVQCSGGADDEEEQGLQINPGQGRVQVPSSTRRLAMEELVRRTRRTSDRRTQRRRSSAVSQAVQLISSITGRARTAKGAKLARNATRTVGIHTLRGLRTKRKRSKKNRMPAASRDWSPPISSDSPERLEAWNNRDKKLTGDVAGFSRSAIKAHKAHKAESTLGARRYLADATPGPSTSVAAPEENFTPVNIIDMITSDIINSSSKTATMGKGGDVLYKSRDEILQEKYKVKSTERKDTHDPPKPSKVKIVTPTKSEKQQVKKKGAVIVDTDSEDPVVSDEPTEGKELPAVGSPSPRTRRSSSEYSSSPHRNRKKSPPKKVKEKPVAPEREERRKKESQSEEGELSEREAEEIKPVVLKESKKHHKKKEKNKKSEEEPEKLTHKKSKKHHKHKEKERYDSEAEDKKRSRSAKKKKKKDKDRSKESDTSVSRERRGKHKKSSKSKEKARKRSRSKSRDRSRSRSRSRSRNSSKERSISRDSSHGKYRSKSKDSSVLKVKSKSPERIEPTPKSDRSSRSASLEIVENPKLRDRVRKTKMQSSSEAKSPERPRRTSVGKKVPERKRSTDRRPLDNSRERNISRDRRDSRNYSRSDTRRVAVRYDEFGRDVSLKKTPSAPPKKDDITANLLEALKGSIKLKEIPKPSPMKAKDRAWGRDSILPSSKIKTYQPQKAEKVQETILGNLDDVYSPGEESPLDDVWPTKQRTVSQTSFENMPMPAAMIPRPTTKIPTKTPTKTDVASLVKKLVNPNSRPEESTDSDSDNMVIDSEEEKARTPPSKFVSSFSSRKAAPPLKPKSPTSPELSNLSDLIIKMKRAEEAASMPVARTPSPTTPEFLKETQETSSLSSPTESPSASTPEYLMTPPEIQLARRQERLDRSKDLAKEHTRPLDKQPSLSQKRPCRKSSETETRRRKASETETRRRKASETETRRRKASETEPRRPKPSEAESKRPEVSETTERRRKPSEPDERRRKNSEPDQKMSERDRQRSESFQKRQRPERKRSGSGDKRSDSDRRPARRERRSSGNERRSRRLSDKRVSTSDRRRSANDRRAGDKRESGAEKKQARRPSGDGRRRSERKPSGSRDNDKSLKEEGREGSKEGTPVIPGLDASPPPPPPPPPRGSVIIQDHHMERSKTPVSVPTVPEPAPSLTNGSSTAPLVYVNTNGAARKRARLDPPLANNVSKIMGSPSKIFRGYEDQYAMQQFEDAWTMEAECIPPTAVKGEQEKAPPTDPREANKNNPREANKNNPIRLIMESLMSRGASAERPDSRDVQGAGDMDIEDDDVPPPPPVSTNPTHPPKHKKATVKQDVKQAGKQDKKVLQQEIANIVKLALKVPYKKKRISKEDYKNIMKHVVQKVYESRHVQRGDPLRPDKITEMVAVYIKQSKHKAKSCKDIVGQDVAAAVEAAG